MERSRWRGFAIVAVAVVVAAACVGLGLWQLRRLDDRRTVNAAIMTARSAPAVTIRSAADVAALAPFRRVVAEGTYDLEGEVVVYGRALDGEPGHHVVTPLALDDGSAVLVIRGWVPFRMDTAPVAVAPPIARDVVVEGFLVAAESRGSSPPDAHGVVRSLDPGAIAQPLPFDVAPLALQLEEQRPPQPGLPTPVPPPELSEGPHLSYAIQWFSFATIAVVGAAVLLRRDRRSLQQPLDDEPGGGAPHDHRDDVPAQPPDPQEGDRRDAEREGVERRPHRDRHVAAQERDRPDLPEEGEDTEGHGEVGDHADDRGHHRLKG